MVPILAVGKPPIYLTESADIVEYIVQSVPELQPIGDFQRAQSSHFSRVALRTLQPELLPVIGKRLTTAEQEVYHERQLEAIFTTQNLMHPEGPFVLGSKLTIADILIAPFVGRLYAYGKHGIAPAGKRTFETINTDPRYARFLKYVLAITARDSWKSTWDEDFSIGRLTAKIAEAELSHPRFLPEPFDPNEVFPDPEPFEHEDPGNRADPAFPELLPPGVEVEHLTPVIGTEVTGIQLSELTSEGRDQLSRFVSERGVVVFRKQNFKDIEPEDQLKFIRHFGPHYLHPSDRHPKDLPQYYSIFQDAKEKSVNNSVNVIANHLTSVTWHTDGSSELNPPGITLLFVLETPRNGGGDTLYTSTVEAYERLSPEFQKRLEGLEAEHYLPYNPRRREAPRNVHPIVRTHPVTGKKCLFVNEEESDNLLCFLTGHIARGQDFACRVKWEAGSVVVWDNRSTQHTATTNFPSDERRHLCRITSLAERPV
ncbi:hypothetical protein CI109_105898 [Kwoniella shandongensis]|uniref:TauD/TfdA-like domain-containing protein n=1 Tax=Kwoniella shandongensis TaxID=1734106 RepID=A0AAJ8MZF8_9TREE